MLTRQAIHSGAYLENFESLPDLWSRERIEAYLAETMRDQPAEATDVWIFAYGSLIWNPTVIMASKQAATLQDWQRSFCLRMVVGRGSPDKPGRMLALEAGGHTDGVALKLSEDTVNEELLLVWIREMVLGSYLPKWAPVTFRDGARTHALAFVADTTRDQFEPDSSVPTVAPFIASASGNFGTNVEYLHKLHASLEAHGLQDPYIDALSNATKQFELKPACDLRGVHE